MPHKLLETIPQIALSVSVLLVTSSSLFPQSSTGSESGSGETVEKAAHAPSLTRRDRFRAAVDLVLVPVTVTDTLNHPQTALGRESFRIFDAGKPQQIRYFSAEDSPISVGLLLDVSNSMQDKIDTLRTAVEEFFQNANPEDDYFAITFNNQPRVLSDVTQSIAGIETELGLVKPSGSTALLDAVYLGISKLQKARYQRRALVIISDGGDNSSRYRLKEIKNLVSESDVMVYAVGLFDSGPFRSFEEVMGRRWLSTITDVSGGRTTAVETQVKVPEVCAMLSRELRTQYVLGYHPRDKDNQGQWHKIKIIVASPSDDNPFRAYYKKGYYSFNP